MLERERWTSKWDREWKARRTKNRHLHDGKPLSKIVLSLQKASQCGTNIREYLSTITTTSSISGISACYFSILSRSLPLCQQPFFPSAACLASSLRPMPYPMYKSEATHSDLSHQLKCHLRPLPLGPIIPTSRSHRIGSKIQAHLHSHYQRGSRLISSLRRSRQPARRMVPPQADPSPALRPLRGISLAVPSPSHIHALRLSRRRSQENRADTRTGGRADSGHLPRDPGPAPGRCSTRKQRPLHHHHHRLLLFPLSLFHLLCASQSDLLVHLAQPCLPTRSCC